MSRLIKRNREDNPSELIGEVRAYEEMWCSLVAYQLKARKKGA